VISSCPHVFVRTNIVFSDIVSGMDVAEMEESFHEYHEGDYHPFKNGSILLE
jgi:hypothetical protein